MSFSPPDPRLARPQRVYFSQRQGRGRHASTRTIEDLAKSLAHLLGRFQDSGYFAEAFGYWCVDAHDVPGSVGDPGTYFEVAIGRSEIWPFNAEVVVESDHAWSKEVDTAWHLWDRDTWLDVLEVLYDVVSQPVDGWFHDYSGCGWHYSKFDKTTGRNLFRDELNWLLSQAEPRFEMTPGGEIVAAAPDGFELLVDAQVPPDVETDEVAQRLEDAKRLFRARDSTATDRLRAIRELADVLEHLRPEMKKLMVSKDESDLFRIINSFAIRHNNPQQMREYDRATWHRWMFYVFLATIHAVLRVRERDT